MQPRKKRLRKSEESASDIFVKFVMSHNRSLDVSKNSHFHNLLRKVAQQGQKSSLFLDNSTVIQKSLWNFKNEIKQYMRMVIGSWSTTQCTVMSYNLKGAGRSQLVLGFYCPKGFIFLQGGRLEEEVGKELADIMSDSSSNFLNVLQFVQHDHSYHSECGYQAHDVAEDGRRYNSFTEVNCMRQEVHLFWRSICKKSKWIQSLINKTDIIIDCLINSDLSGEFYNTLKQKGVVHVVSRKTASFFERLRMVMSVRSEMRDWLSERRDWLHIQNDSEVTSIISDDEFWSDGNQLVQVLAPFYKVPNLLDTLVPSAGYSGLALDKASCLLKSYAESEPLKYEEIWECFKIWRFEECLRPYQDLACYLNPCYYILGEDDKEDIPGELLTWLYDLAGFGYCDEDDQRAVNVEVDAYCDESSNPFAGVSEAEFKENHPIKLWSKYGDGFPFLQRSAYIVLSQPASCLCKQVEKFASKLEGSNNFILRLNWLMMQEFVKLGLQVYQPIQI